MQRYLGATILILISVLVSWFYYPQGNMMQSETISLDPGKSAEGSTKDKAPAIPWQLLQKLDYKNNRIDDVELKAAIDHYVKVPGFAVPLTDNLREVHEFLLVPNQMACIHVPPPPPNLIVFVRLDKPLPIDELMGPLWARGVLRLKTLQSVYGASSYQLEDVSIEPYEF